MVAFGKKFDDPGQPIRVVIDEEEAKDMLLAVAHEKLMKVIRQAADAGKGFGETSKLLGLTRKELGRLIESVKHGRHAVAATEVGQKVYEMLLDIENE